MSFKTEILGTITEETLTMVIIDHLSDRRPLAHLERVIRKDMHDQLHEVAGALSLRKFQLIESVYELFDELRQHLGDTPLAYNLEHIERISRELRPYGGPEIEGIRCMMCLLNLNDWAWSQVRYENIN